MMTMRGGEGVEEREKMIRMSRKIMIMGLKPERMEHPVKLEVQ